MDEIESENDIDSKYDIKNIECPDNNPSVKYIVFIYIELILHILVDLLFIVEFFFVRKLNTLYLEMVKNNQMQVPTKTPDCNSNSSNNRVNTPSANEIIVNIDKRQLRYHNEMNSENDEDIKMDNNSGNNDKETIENYNQKRRLKIERNDNRQLNIINVNQNIKICKDKNDGALLINAAKSPKKKGKSKTKKIKNEQKNIPKRNEIEECMKEDKKHYYLKSSQLQNLINISIDNEEKKSSKYENNNHIQTILKEKIKKKNKNKVNETNSTIKNILKNINENVKDNQEIYLQNLINIDENKNKIEEIKNKNLNIIIDKNNNKEKIIRKAKDNILVNHNKSFNGKSNILLEEKKIMENKDENKNKINRNNILENIHINSEVSLNDEDSEENKKNELL
jgi:hypothetical protein